MTTRKLLVHPETKRLLFALPNNQSVRLATIDDAGVDACDCCGEENLNDEVLMFEPCCLRANGYEPPYLPEKCEGQGDEDRSRNIFVTLRMLMNSCYRAKLEDYNLPMTLRYQGKCWYRISHPCIRTVREVLREGYSVVRGGIGCAVPSQDEIDREVEICEWEQCGGPLPCCLDCCYYNICNGPCCTAIIDGDEETLTCCNYGNEVTVNTYYQTYYNYRDYVVAPCDGWCNTFTPVVNRTISEQETRQSTIFTKKCFNPQNVYEGYSEGRVENYYNREERVYDYPGIRVNPNTGELECNLTPVEYVYPETNLEIIEWDRPYEWTGELGDFSCHLCFSECDSVTQTSTCCTPNLDCGGDINPNPSPCTMDTVNLHCQGSFSRGEIIPNFNLDTGCYPKRYSKRIENLSSDCRGYFYREIEEGTEWIGNGNCTNPGWLVWKTSNRTTLRYKQIIGSGPNGVCGDVCGKWRENPNRTGRICTPRPGSDGNRPINGQLDVMEVRMAKASNSGDFF